MDYRFNGLEKPIANKWMSVFGLPILRANRILLMLQVYIDDSGKGQFPVFVLAGYMATAEQWNDFAGEWQAVLDKPQPIKYFKMNEAHQLIKQFNKWSPEARDERLFQLISVIQRNVQLGIQSVVHLHAYNNIIKGKIAKPMNNPYFLSFYGIMIALYRYHLEHPLTDKVDFIFDEQLKQSDQVQAGYSKFVDLMPPVFKPILGGRPMHRSELDAVPLQAADMLAWHVRRKYWVEEVGKDYDDPLRNRLLEIPLIKDTWDNQRLSSFLAMTRKINRDEGMIFPYNA